MRARCATSLKPFDPQLRILQRRFAAVSPNPKWVLVAPTGLVEGQFAEGRPGAAILSTLCSALALIHRLRSAGSPGRESQMPFEQAEGCATAATAVHVGRPPPMVQGVEDIHAVPKRLDRPPSTFRTALVLSYWSYYFLSLISRVPVAGASPVPG